MDDELETFLRLDLRDYLTAEGWELDQAESTRDSFKFRRGSHVLIVREREDGVWQYFNPQDPQDNGTIIQYLQRRNGVGFTLGHVRKHLRGKPRGGMVPKWARAARVPKPLDLAAVAARWEAAQPVFDLPHYLEGRNITAATVAAFAASLRMDKRGNVLFSHTNDAGQVVGYEISGPDFKGFSKGGVRVLCRLGPIDGGEPVKIALVESGVDALSLAQLVGRRDALFVSTGGALSPHTLNAIKSAAARYPVAEILLAFDADEAGESYARQVTQALEGRDGVRRVAPQAKDWNDILQARAVKPRGAATSQP